MHTVYLRLLTGLGCALFSSSSLSAADFSLAAGSAHACELTGTGGVKCWGANGSGQLGDSLETNSSVAIDVIGLAGEAIAVTTGTSHTCALIKGGTVQCWGRNIYGELGNGTKISSLTPTMVTTSTGFTHTAKAIDAAERHTCAVLANGEVWCWGSNLAGELADVNAVETPFPTKAMGVASAAISVTVGGYGAYSHTCAVLDTRKVQCWGRNDYGQSGNPAAGGNTPFFVQDSNGVDLSNIRSITAGEAHTCALDMAGQVWCWGYNGSGQIGNGQSGFGITQPTAQQISINGTAIEITAGMAHTCVREISGQVECWGRNQSGQLGNGTHDDSALPTLAIPHHLSAISAGRVFTCGRKADGITQCWGHNNAGQLGNNSTNDNSVGVDVVQFSPSGYKQIAAGASHTCAITQNDGVDCWGSNYLGELGNGSNSSTSLAVTAQGLSSGVKQVAVGSSHSCAVMIAGGVKCWGYHSQLGNGATIDSSVPVDVLSAPGGAPLADIQAISANDFQTCALTNTGNVKCWGGSDTPVDVPGLTNITAIAVGLSHVCALTVTSGVKCWGSNDFGQLGNDTINDSTTPVDVINASGDPTLLSGITAIAAGSGYTCALAATKQVKCWGVNWNGQLGDNTTTHRHAPVDVVADQNGGLLGNIVALAAHNAHACAITDIGTAKCWGLNNAGGLGNGQISPFSPFPVNVVDGSGFGLSNLQSIAVGDIHSCAITTGGNVLCWGDNSDGQLGNGNTGNQTVPSPVLTPFVYDIIFQSPFEESF